MHPRRLVERLRPGGGQPFNHFVGKAGNRRIIEICRNPHSRIAPNRLPLALLPLDIRRIEGIGPALGLNADVICAKAERIAGAFDAITARAVAPLGELLRISQHLSTGKTVWALPKGRSALGELSEARRAWQGAFRVAQSVTDRESRIVVATGVRAKA